METPAEKQRREEERRRREEEERRRREEEAAQYDQDDTPKGGWLSRSLSKLQDFGRKLISEENEDDNNR